MPTLSSLTTQIATSTTSGSASDDTVNSQSLAKQDQIWAKSGRRRRQAHDDAMTSPSWWRHQMETFSAQLALCAGNSPVPVNSPHKGQWRGALMFTLICVWINGWVNNREAGDLRRYRGHYDVIVMLLRETTSHECGLADPPTTCGFPTQRAANAELLCFLWS